LGIYYRGGGGDLAPDPFTVGHRQRVGHAFEGATARKAEKPAQRGLS
jgi:hypothetical protein